MRITVTADLQEFADRASGYLEADIGRNLLATILATLVKDTRVTGDPGSAFGGGPPTFAYGTDEATGEVVAAAMRTPPYKLTAVDFDDTEAASELAERWLAVDPQPPGVSAPPRTAAALLEAFRLQTDAGSERQYGMAMHSLTEVIEPRLPADGHLVAAGAEHAGLLTGWTEQFLIETGHEEIDQAASMVRRALDDGTLHIWQTEEPVTMVGHRPPVSGVCRIGPVYTPPPQRARGYATHATAAVSRLLLKSGAQKCMLFTDLANPTSNAIYASIGYRRFGDWEEHTFL